MSNQPIDPIKLDINKFNHELNFRGKLESFKAMNSFALSVIKGLFYSNAGAIGVLLAFVGNNSRDDIYIKSAVIVFVFGITASVLVSCFSYLAQGYFTDDKNSFGNFLKVIAIFFTVCSLICFNYGALIATKVCSPIFLNPTTKTNPN
jgi:hypothetical protein